MKDVRRSLTSSTLTSVAIRISIVIALTATVTYIHLWQQIQNSALQTLEKYVHERTLREREIFQLAQDNHQTMRKELVSVLAAMESSHQDPVREFDSLARKESDGGWRSPRAQSSTKKEIDIWIAKNAPMSPLLRRKIVEFSKVLLRYGPAFHTRFTDTYIALDENANVVYWPEFPDWSAGNASDFDFHSYELYSNGDHQHNPERKTLWTGLYFDDAVKEWMVSASTPFDDKNGKFVGIIGHDVMVGELIKRTTNEGLPGTYNIIINHDGRLIAHPQKMDLITQAKGNLKIVDTKDPVLEAIYQEITHASGAAQTGTRIIDHKNYDQFIAVSQMPETGWSFVTIYPKSLIREIANQTAMFIIALGLLSLILELVILYFIFRNKVSKPLEQFVQATHEIESGRPTVSLPTNRVDEIGTLSRSFESMAEKIRNSNEILREKVEQRTKELQESQKVAMQNAHAAGMAEIATNILHNIGNTINSVNLSILEMEELIEKSPTKNLERALKMIEENQDHLADYLTQDPKGKLLPNYLAELSKSVAENRQSSLETFQYLLRKIKMIEDIVISQQQYVKLGVFSETVDMKEVVNESIGLLNLGKPRENFRLITQMADSLEVSAQKVKIMQIVVNLLKNAVESVEMNPASVDKFIEIQLFQKENFVHLIIKDSGQGISQENLQKIFGHGFTTKKTGHGFGLHFCANAAHELGGTLHAESAGEGQGATFILRLPKKGST